MGKFILINDTCAIDATTIDAVVQTDEWVHIYINAKDEPISLKRTDIVNVQTLHKIIHTATM